MRQLDFVAVELPTSDACRKADCDGHIEWLIGNEFPKCDRCSQWYCFAGARPADAKRIADLESQLEEGRSEPNRVAIFHDFPDNEESRALAATIREDLGKEHTALRARAKSDAETIAMLEGVIEAAERGAARGAGGKPKDIAEVRPTTHGWSVWVDGKQILAELPKKKAVRVATVINSASRCEGNTDGN